MKITENDIIQDLKILNKKLKPGALKRNVTMYRFKSYCFTAVTLALGDEYDGSLIHIRRAYIDLIQQSFEYMQEYDKEMLYLLDKVITYIKSKSGAVVNTEILDDVEKLKKELYDTLLELN